MSKPKQTKPFWEMTTEELSVATAEFDHESPPGRFRPMNAEERAQWERVKRKRGRPRVGKGAEVVSVSLERDLLRRSDRVARRMGVSRSGLIAELLRRAVAADGSAARTRVRKGTASKRGTRRAA